MSISLTFTYLILISTVVSAGQEIQLTHDVYRLHEPDVYDNKVTWAGSHNNSVILGEKSGTYAYVATSRNVSVIDTADNNITATINVGTGTRSIAVTPNGKKAYVTCSDDTVSVIDVATNNVTATVNVGERPEGVAVNPAGTKVYVTNYDSNTVSVIDVATDTVIATVPVGLNPIGVAVNPKGTNVYVANFNSGNLSIIDTSIDTVIATVDLVSQLEGVAVNPDGTKVYVTSPGGQGGNGIYVIDTSTNNVTATIAAGLHALPGGVAVNPAGTKVYVTNMMGKTVSVIDTATNTITKLVNVGGKPYGVAVTPDGTKVYVANEDSYNISVIDTATNNVTATVELDSIPFGVAITPVLKPVTSGSLVQVEGHPQVYLIENSMKRHFTSPEALLWNGYSFDNVTTVSNETLQSYPDGEDIIISQAIIDKYHELGGEPIFGASAGEGEKDGDSDSAGTYCSYVNFKNGSIEYFKNGDLAGKAYAVFNPFFNKWASMGYAKSVLGYPIDNMSNEETSKFGTKFRYQNFANGTEKGAIEYNLTSDEVFEIHGAIFAKWGALGYANSELGLVTSDERDATPSFKGTTGRVSDFENGHLHWHSSGDHYMTTYMTYGDLDKLYVSMGGTASDLGFPIMDQEERNGHDYCEFEGGNISWDASSEKYIVKLNDVVSTIAVGQGASTPEIAQKFIDACNRNGGLSVLGNPTTKVHSAFGFEVQDFPEMPATAGGVIMYNPNNNNAYFIHGAIWEKYYNFADKTKLGPVAGDEKIAAVSPYGTVGNYSEFESGHIHWISDKDGENEGKSYRGKSFITYGNLDSIYTSMYGTIGPLGFPIKDQTESGDGYCEFEGGFIKLNGSEQKVVFRVMGTIQYFDATKENSDGTIGGFKPLRYAKVEIDSNQNPEDDVLGTTTTNENGNFDCFIQYDKELKNNYFRVYADSYITSVIDQTNGKKYYESIVGNNPSDLIHVNILINDADVNPLFNVYENVQRAYKEFSKGFPLDKVTVSLTNDPQGVYSVSDNGITISKTNYIQWLAVGKNSEVLGYNSEVYHEYGHFVHLRTIYKNLDDKKLPALGFEQPVYTADTDNEFGGWIEGWAFFCPAVVYNNPFYFLEKKEYTIWGVYEVYTGMEDAHYQECKGSLCSPLDFKSYNRNINNLGRVASFLWDVYDGISEEESYDLIDGKNNIKPILDIMDDKYTTKIYDDSENLFKSFDHTSPLSIREFFSGYLRSNPGQAKELTELAKYHFSERNGYLQMTANCPINLHLYNSLNEHIGLNESTGEIDTNIAGSYYSGPDSEPEEIFLIRGDYDTNLECVIEGTGEGTFNLSYESASNGKISKVFYHDINITNKSLGYINDNVSDEKYILKMDYDGNGILDEIIPPTNVTTSGEDLLNVSFIVPSSSSSQFDLSKDEILPIKFTALNNSTNEFVLDNEVNITISNSLGTVIANYSGNEILIDPEEKCYLINFKVPDYQQVMGDNVFSIQVTFGRIDNLKGYAITYFTLVDHNSPSSVTHLQSLTGDNWINWTWINPSDPDFNHTEIYLDGIFQTNTSAEYYNAIGLKPDTSYTISTRTVDNNGNINETWVNSSAKTKPDTISPVIESAVIFPVNTTAGSKISVTVNATDNIRVANVTAGDVQLMKVDGLWRGNIITPSSSGKYSLSIKANDAAGNTANVSVPYNVVRRQGGVNVAVLPTTSKVVAGKNTTMAIKIKNTQNIDDTFKVRVNFNGIPSFFRTGDSWFNWTEKTLNLRAKQEVLIPIEVKVPTGTVSGLKVFKVSVNSEKYSVHGSDTESLVISRPFKSINKQIGPRGLWFSRW